MSYIYKNIIVKTATDLEVSSSPRESVTKASIANKHASDSVFVDLYLSRIERDNDGLTVGEDKRRSDRSYNELPTTTYEYCILKNCIIPKGVTLILDESSLFFDQTKYRLYIKLEADGSSVAVDVIISYDKQGSSTSSTMSTGFTSSSY